MSKEFPGEARQVWSLHLAHQTSVCVCSRAGELQTSKVVFVHMAERFCLVWGIENAWQQHLHLKFKDQRPMNSENLMVQALLKGCFDNES